MLDLGLDCQPCDETLKRERGCYGQSQVAWYVDGVQYRRCPKKLIPLEVYEYFKAYNLFQKGLLPNSLTWGNESNKFIDAMIYLEGEMTVLEQEKMKRNEKKNAR